MRYSVQVKPGSKREEVVRLSDDSLLVRTHARAHDGEANSAVIKLLAEHFRVSKSSISIIRGVKSKNKMIDIV